MTAPQDRAASGAGPSPARLRRLTADEAFPAGWAGHQVRQVPLAHGEQVRLVECTPAAGADAPAVLFVHGWACSAYGWRHNMGPMAAAGYRALAPDLLGHGFSDKPLDDDRRYGADGLADMLVRVLDAAGVGRALVVGHSMGAAVALRLAAVRPDRVAGLVLAAPVGFGGVGRTWWLRLVTPPVVEPLLAAAATRPLFALGLRMGYGRLGAPTERDVDEYWAPTADPRFPRALRRIAHAFDWEAGPQESFALVRCPVHCLFGERDDVIRMRVARPALARLANARAEVVAGAGHVIPEEAPDVVNRTILGMAAEVFAPAVG
ncbi:MAG TPA: alpha/beta hydrolase [Gemmatirosa sp.]|nr:alpha/beta hydrolase [Gemmatirosa sp.]